MSGRVLRASEIGEYVFCHRAWWLHRVQGIESANRAQMERGTAGHAAHGRTLQRAEWMQRTAFVLIAFAFVLAIIGTIVLMVGR